MKEVRMIGLVVILIFATTLVAQSVEVPDTTNYFTSASEAYVAGKEKGYADGLAAGMDAAKQKLRNQAPKSYEICQVPPSIPYSYGSDYERGYRAGYEIGYWEGYGQGKREHQGFECGFGMGCLLGLIGVIIAAVMP